MTVVTGPQPAVQYASVDELKLVLAPPGLEAKTPAEMPDEVLDQVLVQASGDVDGYCAGSYPTPFAAPVPRVIWSLTLNIAQYYAMLTHRRGADIQESEPSLIRYRNAVKFLEGIADGTITLESDATVGGAGGEESMGSQDVSAPDAGYLYATQEETLFGPSDLGYDTWPTHDLPTRNWT